MTTYIKLIVLPMVFILLEAIFPIQQTFLAAENKQPSFTINIVNFYFGRENNRVILTNANLFVQEKLYQHRKKPVVRPLPPEETEALTQFILQFKLEDLQEKYINSEVKDGIHIKFDIRINGQEKTIHVANMYQPQLGKLLELIRPMLPDNLLPYPKSIMPVTNLTREQSHLQMPREEIQ